jgi:integrase
MSVRKEPFLNNFPDYNTISHKEKSFGGGICMEGRIYENKGKGSKYYLRFRKVFKRSNDLEHLERMLTGLRYKADEGTFDRRDYQKDTPLGFENLSNKWLEIKKQEVRCYRNLVNHIGYATGYFHNKNIKEIRYAELEDFFTSLPIHLSDKSKHNIKTTLHSFWTWLKKRRILKLDQMPEFPEIKFELKWRNTVDKETQAAILEEIKRITYHINPKIWIAAKWLSTYIMVRPIEFMNVQEEDFDLSLGIVNIRHNKEQKSKIVPLLKEDIEIVKSFPRALPHVYFFRHGHRKGVAPKVQRFGKDYIYKWWKLACKNLGIDNVDLYGGTRHSSARALREFNSPEQIKKATMHSTNKAFERYFQIELEDVRNILKNTQGVAHQVHIKK